MYNGLYINDSAWRDRHDMPSRIQAGRQDDGRRVERAMRPPRTPGAVQPARRCEHDDRNKEGPRHRHVPR